MPVDWNKPVEVKGFDGWFKAHSVAVDKINPKYAAVIWYAGSTVRADLLHANNPDLRNTPEPEQGWRYFVGASGVKYRASPRTCQRLLDDGTWGKPENDGLDWFLGRSFWTETDADWKPLNEAKVAQVEHPVFGDDWHITVGDLKRAIAYLRRSTETNPHFKHVFEGIIFAMKVLVTEDKPGRFTESAGR